MFLTPRAIWSHLKEYIFLFMFCLYHAKAINKSPNIKVYYIKINSVEKVY